MGKRLQRPFSVTTGFKPVVTEAGETAESEDSAQQRNLKPHTKPPQTLCPLSLAPFAFRLSPCAPILFIP